MKNVSKLVQLALVCAVVLTGQQMFAFFGDKTKKAEQPSVTDDLQPVFKNQQQIAQEKAAAQKTTTVDQKQEAFKQAATQVQQFWNDYNGIQRDSSYLLPYYNIGQLKKNFIDLEAFIKKTNRNVQNQYYIAKSTIENNSQIHNQSAVWEALNNLLQAINTEAPIGLQESLKVWPAAIPPYNPQYNPQQQQTGGYSLSQPGQPQISRPRYANAATTSPVFQPPVFQRAYEKASQAASSAIQPARDAVSSINERLASGWQYGKQVASSAGETLSSWRKWLKPTDAECIQARLELKELGKLEQYDVSTLNAQQKNRLNELKQLESYNQTLVQRWWPYIFGVGAASYYMYQNPESAKEIISGAFGVGKSVIGTAAGALTTKAGLATAAGLTWYGLSGDNTEQQPTSLQYQQPAK